jgi:hypothetical protein
VLVLAGFQLSTLRPIAIAVRSVVIEVPRELLSLSPREARGLDRQHSAREKDATGLLSPR